MTLSEWCKMAGVTHTEPTSEKKAVSVVYSRLNAFYYDLWKLSDYKVDSKSDHDWSVVWLLPRQEMPRLCPTCGK
jgi:hypothetical protein